MDLLTDCFARNITVVVSVTFVPDRQITMWMGSTRLSGGTVENFPVLLSDGEIVDLYFAIETKITEAKEMAEHWAYHFDEDTQRGCLMEVDRLREIKAKLKVAQDILRGNPPSTERR